LFEHVAGHSSTEELLQIGLIGMPSEDDDLDNGPAFSQDTCGEKPNWCPTWTNP
jgi:hypothetical protein